MLFFKNLTLLGMAIAMSLSPMSANATHQLENVAVMQSFPTNKIIFLKERMIEVKPGDNTWSIAQDLFYNGYRWRDLVKQNKFLQEPGRVYYDPKTKFFYCMIHPGEELKTYEEALPAISNVIKPKPFSDADAIADPVGDDFVEPSGSFLPGWLSELWWFWLLLLVILAILLLRRNRKKKLSDPVGSGAPQVPGGVTDENAVRRIENLATSQGFDPLHVYNIQKGRFFGKGRVSYADKPTGLKKRFSGEVGYRGIIRRDDLPDEFVYFLQACGNDVRQGNFFTGVNFVSDVEQPQVVTEWNRQRMASQKTETDQSVKEGQKPFDAKEKVLDLMEQCIKGDKQFFFEVKFPDGTHFDFGSKHSGHQQKKSPVKPNDGNTKSDTSGPKKD